MSPVIIRGHPRLDFEIGGAFGVSCQLCEVLRLMGSVLNCRVPVCHIASDRLRDVY